MGELRIMDPIIQSEVDHLPGHHLASGRQRWPNSQRAGDGAMSAGVRDGAEQPAGVRLRRDGEDRSGTDKQTAREVGSQVSSTSELRLRKALPSTSYHVQGLQSSP